MDASDVHSSLFVNISVHQSLYPSVRFSVPMFFKFYLMHVDSVVHCNVSYNFLPLLFYSFLPNQHLLVADKSSAVRATVSGCVYRLPDGTFGQATSCCLYKQRIPYCMVTSDCAQTCSRLRLASLIIIDKCQRTSYHVDL